MQWEVTNFVRLHEILSADNYRTLVQLTCSGSGTAVPLSSSKFPKLREQFSFYLTRNIIRLPPTVRENLAVYCENHKVKLKVSRNRPEQTQGVRGSLRPRIFLTFGTMRVVGRQPYAPAAFTAGEIPGTHF